MARVSPLNENSGIIKKVNKIYGVIINFALPCDGPLMVWEHIEKINAIVKVLIITTLSPNSSPYPQVGPQPLMVELLS